MWSPPLLAKTVSPLIYYLINFLSFSFWQKYGLIYVTRICYSTNENLLEKKNENLCLTNGARDVWKKLIKKKVIFVACRRNRVRPAVVAGRHKKSRKRWNFREIKKKMENIWPNDDTSFNKFNLSKIGFDDLLPARVLSSFSWEKSMCDLIANAPTINHSMLESTASNRISPIKKCLPFALCVSQRIKYDKNENRKSRKTHDDIKQNAWKKIKRLAKIRQSKFINQTESFHSPSACRCTRTSPNGTQFQPN